MPANSQTTPQRVALLQSAGMSAVLEPLWQQKPDGTTYCNFATDYIASRLGCQMLHDAKKQPFLANAMINLIDRSDKWQKVPGTAAWDWAMQGGLAVATCEEAPQGHITVLAPGPRVWSTKWQMYCPVVYNVGKADGMNHTSPFWIGENFAFYDRPVHYIYKP